MKKRVLFFSIFALISLAGFVSAQSVISDIFTGIDPTLITLAILFVIFFAVLYFSTSKIFKGNRAIPAVISLAVSLLIIYWVNQAVSINNIFSGIGISGDNLYTIGSIVLIAFIIFLFVKIKSKTLFVLGGLFIAAAVTNLVFETTAIGIIGAILIILGIIFAAKKKPIPLGRSSSLGYSGARANWVSRKQAAANRSAEEEQIRRRMQGDKKEISKERDMTARANAMAVASEDYAKEEARRQASMNALNREKAAQIAQEQQQEHSLQNQVGSYLDSLRQSFRRLQADYDSIIKLNPQDPRLRDIYNELVAVRSEIQRVMRSQK